MSTTYDFIAIEEQTLFGNKQPTYFVDLVTVTDHNSHGNLASFKDKHKARAYARLRADELGLRVKDESLVKDLLASFYAYSDARIAISKASEHE